MSESYMKKGLEAQKPTEVMAEGLRFYAGEFLRWGIGKPAEDTPLTLAAVKLMLPLLEGQLDQSTRGNGNLPLWHRKVAEWANAEQQTAPETPAEETTVQESGKGLILEHARMKFNYTSFTDLEMFLRVAVPESGKATVEW